MYFHRIPLIPQKNNIIKVFNVRNKISKKKT